MALVAHCFSRLIWRKEKEKGRKEGWAGVGPSVINGVMRISSDESKSFPLTAENISLATQIFSWGETEDFRKRNYPKNAMTN